MVLAAVAEAADADVVSMGPTAEAASAAAPSSRTLRRESDDAAALTVGSIDTGIYSIGCGRLSGSHAMPG